MTLEAHAARIQSALGLDQPRNQRLPIDLFTPFFEDLWKAGIFPTAPVVQRWLPGCSVQALGMACFEWRSQQGLRLARLKPTEKPPTLTDLVPLLDAALQRWPPQDIPVLIPTTTAVGHHCPEKSCIC